MGCAHWTLLLLSVISVQIVNADLVRVDLSALKAWTLTNTNQSINLPTAVPAHTLSVLASAGVIASDPLYRYGERDTRWVGEERWNFTLIWSSKKHELLTGCRQLLLVLHGIDTFASVALNGQHVVQADNAHRSWWLPLSGPDALRDGANMLTVVLHPAAEMTARAKMAYPYPVPTMQVPGSIGHYNFARKPAFDFGWDWGPAFVPVGITGGVELVGFDRATLIGALASQQYNSSSNTFDLTVTAQFVVPVGGDNGTLSLTIATWELRKRQQVQLQPGTVGGNQLQALITMQLQVPADKVQLWQPLTLAPKGQPRELYDLAVMFEPTVAPTVGKGPGSTCGVAPDTSSSRGSAASRSDGVSSNGASSSSDDRETEGGTTTTSGSSSGDEALGKAPVPEIISTIVRRIGFRTVELVREPIEAAARELLRQPGASKPHNLQQLMLQRKQQQLLPQQTSGEGTAGHGQQADRSQQQQQQQQHAGPVKLQEHRSADKQGSQQTGESFYFRVNGVPLFAKGANLIPLHVLSTAVTERDVRALLQSAVDANMNMIRIWGGGMYQVDELYDAADELGLMVWQEAMFACSPYPRNADFLSNVKSEVTQQLLRLGSHASLVVFGGNNEVEQSIEWYNETRDNPGMYATDYSALFVDAIGTLVHKMLPYTPWVDSSPSRGSMWLPDAPHLQQHNQAEAATATADSKDCVLSQSDSPAVAAAAAAGAGGQSVKRWGNTNDPLYGDVHFYKYRDDCQDWRTYPHARFVSEYGWQSYPSSSTYAAATAQEDWQVTADMTEYRQRHPNGTVELLAQLQRRFKLPQTWLDLLPPSPQHKQPQPQQQQHEQLQQTQPQQRQEQLLQQAAAEEVSLSGFVSQAWHKGWQLAAKASASVHSRLALHLQNSNASSATQGTASTSGAEQQDEVSSPSLGARADGLIPGRWKDRDSTDVPQADSSEGSTTGSTTGNTVMSIKEYSDMQHYVYLTQLQQMLCYETALHTWRRLRSDPNTLSMGVLYWQLNDVWAGASWSSVDYGGVWKPVHYGVARAFADVTLSVQHDLQDDTISVYAVSDLQEPVPVQLAVRLLSITDTSAQCQHHSSSSAGQHNPSDSAGNANSPGSRESVRQYAFEAAHYVKHHKMLKADAPAGSATLLWSKTVTSLLSKAGTACSRTTCYVHIALASEGHADQEATVWLAPFKDLPLQDPQLSLTDEKVVKAAQSGTEALSGTNVRQDAVQFAVSSQGVAAYVVWEIFGGGLAGRFSNNALTIHPCEPRQVTFFPKAMGRRVGGMQAGGRVSKGSSGETDGSGRGQQDDASLKDREQLLLDWVDVHSLWDHQQFDPPLQLQEDLQDDLHEKLVVV